MLTTSPILSPATTASPTTTNNINTNSSFHDHDGSARPSQEQAAASSRQPVPANPIAVPTSIPIPIPSPKPHRRPSSRSTRSSRSTTASSTSLSPAIRHSETSMTTVPSQQPPLRRPEGPIASPSISAPASAPALSPSSTANIARSILAQHDDDSQRPVQGSAPLTAASGTGDAPMMTQPSPTVAQIQNTLSPNNKRRSPHTTHDARHHDTTTATTATATTTASVAQAASLLAGAGSGAAGGGASRPSSPNNSKRARPDEQPDKVLPSRYELCPVDDMVQLIAHMLGELIATNDAIQISSGGLTRFHSRTAPAISVRDYLHRLARHATLTPPLLLSMVYYIDRLCALYPEFTINTLTVHRFLITAATVAAKGLSDSFWNNSTYARVGGVRVAELKLLELEFLYRVDWKIVPNPDVLVAYYQGLVHRCPRYACEAGSNASDDDEEIGDDDDIINNNEGGSEKTSNE